MRKKCLFTEKGTFFFLICMSQILTKDVKICYIRNGGFYGGRNVKKAICPL